MRRHSYLLLLLLFPLMLSAHGKRALVWVLDAGHGGKDVGCEGTKCQEKDITLAITLEVARLLRVNKPGIRVILTRDKDEYLTLDERCQKANRANADLFLSIHVNYAPNNKLLQGTETFFASTRKGDDAVLQAARVRNADKSELLAWLLQKSYYDAGRVADRGAKTEHLYVVMNTMMPAALTEVGFMSNIEEQAYVKSDRGQKEIAACIYDALIQYYTTTQAKTHTQTLATLRRTNGTSSGLNCPKIAPKASEGPYMPSIPSLATAANGDDNIPPPLIPETFEEGELEQLAIAGQGIVSEEQKEVLRPADSSTDNIPPPLIPETFDEAPQTAAIDQSVAPKVLIDQSVAPEVLVKQTEKLDSESKSDKEPIVPVPVVESVEKEPLVVPVPNQVAEEKKEPLVPAPKQVEEKEPLIPIPKVEEKEPLVPAPKEMTEEKETIAQNPKKEEKVPVEETPKEEPSKAMPVFSIQIVSVSSELKSNDPRLKGLSPITFVKSGTMFKGLYGGTTDYKQAKATLESIRKKFPDAFIVAYLGETPIATAEAIEMAAKK